MIKTALLGVVALTLTGLVPGVSFARSSEQVGLGDLAAYCDQSGSATDRDVVIDVGNGSSVSATLHCGTSGVSVSSNDDHESEAGPSEAAENGKED